MRPTAVRRRVRLALVGLAIAAVVATALPAQQAAADHTPLPSTVTLVGSLQSELGCPGDWQPECDATHLEPVAGQPGVFQGTFTVPAGSFEYKVALNDAWDENYGAGGVAGGANLPIVAPGGAVTFTYNHHTHIISDDLPKAVTAQQAAHWVRRDLIAWDLPAEREGFSYRLYWAAEGGLVNDNGAITGGSSVPLELVPPGCRPRCDGSFRTWPTTRRCESPRRCAAASRDPDRTDRRSGVRRNGGLVSATGVQIPGVLDDVYSGAKKRSLGPTWRQGRPTLAVWAPTAKSVTLLLDPAGSTPEQRVAMRRDADGVWSIRGRAAWRNARYLFEVRVYAPQHGNCGGEPGNRSVLGRSDHQLGALRAGRPQRPGAEAGRLEPARQASAAQAGVLIDL